MDTASRCSHFGCEFSDLAGGFRGSVGQMKDFVGGPACCREGSVGVPTLEVAPLSTMAEGIVRLRTPCLSSASSWKYMCWMLVSVTLAMRLVGKRDVVAMDLWRAARLVFFVRPVLDPSGPSGCDSVVALGVGGEA